MSAHDPMNRRTLLAGLAAGVASLARPASAQAPAAVDPSTVLGPGSTPTGERSAHEAFRALAPQGVVTGPSYSPLHQFVGTLTPTDLQFQRHHAGIAQIDPTHWQLLIHGLVDRPLVFTLDELKRFPSETRIAFLECAGNGRASFRAPKPELTVQEIDGLTANLEWTGVRLSLVLREAGVRPEATWMLAEGGDASRLARSVPIAKALDDAMLVYAANGEPLRPAHGYPVRLLLPGWEANTNIKWLRRLELADEPGMFRDETAKYTEPLADGTARQFSFVMDAKSAITAPTYPTRLTGTGWWPISGLAWSGRGAIRRVEVSTDGGATWSDANLLGTPLPKAHVRFELPWNWTGGEAVLMSRATDDTGYVQPTVAEFRRVRGPGTDLHYNAIRAWHVAPDGAVTFHPDPEAA
ncbi:MAG: sulfite dehydrogenase [Myxococcota bacterium]